MTEETELNRQIKGSIDETTRDSGSDAISAVNGIEDRIDIPYKDVEP